MSYRPLAHWGLTSHFFHGAGTSRLYAPYQDTPKPVAIPRSRRLAAPRPATRETGPNLHMRMRRKVRGWLQVLNRAALASEAPREKKTISGRTFTRK